MTENHIEHDMETGIGRGLHGKSFVFSSMYCDLTVDTKKKHSCFGFRQ